MRRLAVCATAIILVTGTAIAPAASAARGPSNGRLIAYSRLGDRPDFHIQTVDLFTGAIRNIGNLPTATTPDLGDWTYAQEPAFSPSGTSVAYYGTTVDSNISDIWVVGSNGKSNHRLTKTPNVTELHPRYSTDGRWIYYVAAANNVGARNLWRIHPDGSGTTQLTHFVPAQLMSVGAITVGLNRVVFYNDNAGPLYQVNLTGGGLRAIPNTDGGQGPAIGASGKQLLFTRATTIGHGDIYRINIDGTGLRNLTAGAPGQNGSATWSPDETAITFVSSRDVVNEVGQSELYQMAADGTGARRVTFLGPGSGPAQPAWQPTP